MVTRTMIITKRGEILPDGETSQEPAIDGLRVLVEDQRETKAVAVVLGVTIVDASSVLHVEAVVISS